MFSFDEARARWGRVCTMMAENDVDALIAIDLSRDEILFGHQRWLTGYIPVGGPAAALLHRDGRIELISERIGRPVTDYYATHGFPIELVSGFSAQLVAQRISKMAPARLGIVEPESFPALVAKLLSDFTPAPETVDLSDALQNLRLRKSAAELALIRTSCAIADAVWERVPELFRVGRRQFEIIADVEHLMRLAGAEGGFNLLLPLPFLGRAMQSLANGDTIDAGARYLLEISPRYAGYYSQVTIPVTTHPHDADALNAYADVVAAKEAAQLRMVPGSDLSEIALFVADFLQERGRKMASLSLGHFCGMALEEPRHNPALPMRLAEGMTLIFHPVLAHPDYHSLMRADTYHITPSGAERLSKYAGGMLVVSN
jgi:Xaa-Pro aminopeptidase